jgi:hypothetical protein
MPVVNGTRTEVDFAPFRETVLLLHWAPVSEGCSKVAATLRQPWQPFLLRVVLEENLPNIARTGEHFPSTFPEAFRQLPRFRRHNRNCDN